MPDDEQQSASVDQPEILPPAGGISNMMSHIMKSLPRWLLVIVVFYLMVLVAYSLYSGATIRFWPPEIIPRFAATSADDSSDRSD
jgi:hypothetical protein